MMLSEPIMETKKPNLIIGYTTRLHLLLDIDNKSLLQAILIATLIQREWEKVGDCLLVLSSLGSHIERTIYTKLGRPIPIRKLDSYHLIYDATIGYNSCCKIITILAGLGLLNRDYAKIRTFRGDMTLRISPTVNTDRIKPFPKPICYLKSPHKYLRGGKIDEYLVVLNSVLPLYPEPLWQFSPLSLVLQYPRLSNLLRSLSA